MFIEINPDYYNTLSRSIPAPNTKKKNHGFHPTFPIKRYMTHDLTIECKDINDIQKFLNNCSYMSDEERFGKKDYWQPPEDFEKERQGDCEDFALWSWRQLINLGYKAQFIVGISGKNGHAWVTFEKDNQLFLMEPTANSKIKLPQAQLLFYKPDISVEWDGAKFNYFKHDNVERKLPFLKRTFLFAQLVFFYLKQRVLD